MGIYLELSKVQVKLVFKNSLFLTILFLGLTPVIFGVKNLDSIAVAMVLERYISLIGILLLTPLFVPEQNENTSELVEARKVPMTRVYGVRLIMGSMFLLALICIAVGVLRLNNCRFPVIEFLFGTFITAFFLGNLGFIAFGFSKNIAVGYLIPLTYYILNYAMGKKLGKGYLFSLAIGSMEEKYWLLGVTSIIILVVFGYEYVIRRIR